MNFRSAKWTIWRDLMQVDLTSWFDQRENSCPFIHLFHIAHYFRHSTTIPLPMTQGADGPRIFLLRPGQYDPKVYDIAEIFKIYTMFTDLLLLEDDHSIIGGMSGILDMTNLTTDHFMQFQPDFLKKTTLLAQEASPFMPKGFHYVNTPNGFENVFNLFRGFMSKEYKMQVRRRSNAFQWYSHQDF